MEEKLLSHVIEDKLRTIKHPTNTATILLQGKHYPTKQLKHIVTTFKHTPWEAEIVPEGLLVIKWKSQKGEGIIRFKERN